MQSGFKTCSKCGEVKPFELFGLIPKARQNKSGRQMPNANTSGRVAHCKKCQSIAGGEWAKNNQEKCRVSASKWSKSNPEKRYSAELIYARLNRQSINERSKARYAADPSKSKKKTKDQISGLKTIYVARLISAGKFPPSLVPHDLIEAKRAHIKLIRKLKDLKK